MYGTIVATFIYPTTYGLSGIGSSTNIISTTNGTELLINGRDGSSPNSVHIRGGNQNSSDNANGGRLYLYGGDAGTSSINFTTGGSIYIFGGKKTPSSGGADGDVILCHDGSNAYGKLCIGNNINDTSTPGTVVRKLEIFNASGTSLGFIPIYDAIT